MFSRKKNKHKNEPRRSIEGSRPNAPVFSYSAQRLRAEDSTERIYHEPQRHQSNWLGLLPSILSGLVIISSLLYATTLSSLPHVLVVGQNETTLLREPDFYEESLSKVMEESFWNYNKLTINTVGLARQIEERFPELANVAISLPLVGRRPVIQVEARQPAFILVSQQGSFVISHDGRAMLRTRDANLRGLGLISVTDESGIEAALGKAVLPRDNVEFITTLLYQLKSKNVSVQSMILPPISNELHVRLQGRQYFAKFNLQGSALEQAGAFIAIHERLTADGTLPAEYIDVRVEDRVYVR
jgi:cell division septal protein FtsQ